MKALVIQPNMSSKLRFFGPTLVTTHSLSKSPLKDKTKTFLRVELESMRDDKTNDQQLPRISATSLFVLPDLQR